MILSVEAPANPVDGLILPGDAPCGLRANMVRIFNSNNRRAPEHGKSFLRKAHPQLSLQILGAPLGTRRLGPADAADHREAPPRGVHHADCEQTRQLCRWAFAEFTEAYQIEADFEARVEAEFNKLIEGRVKG